MTCKIANYADDKHLYYENKCFDALRIVLENNVNSAILWFDNNFLCANPQKILKQHPDPRWYAITLHLGAGLYNLFRLID